MYLALLLSFSACYTNALVKSAQHFAPENAAEYFEDFISKFGKQYRDEEKAFRFEIFKANLENINRLNYESDHAIFDITIFMDLTSEEFIGRHTGLRTGTYDDHKCTTLTDEDVPDVEVPESYDWRDHGAVGPVKDQSRCGSCWAFATTGLLEGQVAIKHKKYVQLSEQQIINCDRISDGCCGGLIESALVELKNVGGAILETDGSYTMNKVRCNFNRSNVVVKVTDCLHYKLQSQEKLKQLLVATGPLAIAIQASALQGHMSGIISDKSCNVGRVNHAVLLVGYGTENDKPYWTCKNSWGNYSVEGGYFRIQRSDNMVGACDMFEWGFRTAAIE